MSEPCSEPKSNPTEESIQTAARCWCDDETGSIIFDSRLATAFAKRLDLEKSKSAKLLEALREIKNSHQSYVEIRWIIKTAREAIQQYDEASK